MHAWAFTWAQRPLSSSSVLNLTDLGLPLRALLLRARRCCQCAQLRPHPQRPRALPGTPYLHPQVARPPQRHLPWKTSPDGCRSFVFMDGLQKRHRPPHHDVGQGTHSMLCTAPCQLMYKVPVTRHTPYTPRYIRWTCASRGVEPSPNSSSSSYSAVAAAALSLVPPAGTTDGTLSRLLTLQHAALWTLYVHTAHRWSHHNHPMV
jgi:hypothetical protein